MSERDNAREQTALESLISVVLHQFDTRDSISEEEIDQFLCEACSLSDEQRNALAKLGHNPLESLMDEGKDHHTPPVLREEMPELAGMYRHGSDAGLDSETRKLIEEKRRQIIERLRQKGTLGERSRD
jgi:hypothetical protein